MCHFWYRVISVLHVLSVWNVCLINIKQFRGFKIPAVRVTNLCNYPRRQFLRTALALDITVQTRSLQHACKNNNLANSRRRLFFSTNGLLCITGTSAAIRAQLVSSVLIFRHEHRTIFVSFTPVKKRTVFCSLA